MRWLDKALTMNPSRYALDRYAQRLAERLIDAHGIPLPSLRAQREATELTQAELASLAGISQAKLCSIERGLLPASRKVQGRLAQLHIRIDRLQPLAGDIDNEIQRGTLGYLVLRCCDGREEQKTCARLAVRYNRQGWPWRYSSTAPETLITARGRKVS